VAHCFHIKTCASRPWRLTSGRLNFVCTIYLIKDSVWTGTHIVLTVAAVFPYLSFRTKSFSMLNSERRSNVLLRRLDGCNQEQFKPSQHRGRSRRKVLIFRTDDALTVGHPDGISHRSNRCKGSNCSYFESVQNLLEV